MKNVRLYLCHGFLGLPEDWDSFVEHFQAKAQALGIELIVDKRNLWKDLEVFDSEERFAKTSPFKFWADNFLDEVNSHPEPKIFLGYSFGGRLLMHMDWMAVQGLVLTGYLAAHPGLKSAADRGQRKMDDADWGQKFFERPWAETMMDWNQQGVFLQDRVRPERNEKKYKRNILRSYFEKWTLAHQSVRDAELFENPSQYWFCGSEDRKFIRLLPRMQKALGESHCVALKDSGHGVLWDAPENLAAAVYKILQENDLLGSAERNPA